MRRNYGPGMELLTGELRARWRVLVRIGGWSLVEALPSLLSGLAVAAAIDRFVARDLTGGLGLLALLLPATALGAFATRRLFPCLADIVEPVRDSFITAVVEGAIATATRSAQLADASDVVRLTQQVESVRTVLFSMLRTVRRILFTIVAVIAGMAVLAPAAALITGSLVALALFLFVKQLPRLAARHRAVLIAEEEVARRAGVAFTAVRDCIACGGEDRATTHVCHAVDQHASLSRALARATAARGLFIFVGGQLPLVVLLMAAPWLLRAGHLTVGEVVGAATYLAVSLEPALRGLVSMVGVQGLDLVVNLERVGAAFVRPGPPEPRGVRTSGVYELAIEDLTFAYGPHAEPVLSGLTFTLQADDHLAVVGPSGIGKSTLANLLTGLLAPQGGSVRLGGIDLRRIDQGDLRQLVALIPQEAYIFAGTLRENLAYLAPTVDQQDLALAAAAVGLQPLVVRLGGFDALVGAGGAELSTGEKQLVALTRVYLSPARVVILDEATSNLDPAAEARAEAAFIARPGSVVVIAHRISSARRAEKVLLLDGDRIYLGSHAELLTRSALYADLVGRWDIDRETSGAFL